MYVCMYVQHESPRFAACAASNFDKVCSRLFVASLLRTTRTKKKKKDADKRNDAPLVFDPSLMASLTHRCPCLLLPRHFH